MNIEPQDVLTVIQNKPKSKFEFPFYDGATNNMTITQKLPTLEAGSSTTWLMDGDKRMEFTNYLIGKFFNDLWSKVAAVVMDGEMICKREAFGQSMLALNHKIFQQSDYERFVEADLINQRTGREVLVDDLNLSGAGSIMRGFMEWHKKNDDSEEK
jgi:hypothetical protein